MDALVRVRILVPAKLGGRWLKPGDEPEVTPEEKTALQEAGVVASDASPEDGAAPGLRSLMTVAEWEAAVEKRALELAGAAFDGELVRLEAEVKSIIAAGEVENAAVVKRAELAEAERDEWKAQVTTREAEVNALEARVSLLQGRIVAHLQRIDELTPPPGDEPVPENTHTPPEAKAAKTTPKKGAAAPTKG